MSAPTTLAQSPVATDIPDGVDLSGVLADVADDSVSAPAADVDGLLDVVARASNESIPLSVVVVDRDAAQDSQLRDLATEVGAQNGGTVLVLSPGQVGSFSDSISRVVLESGQDRAYTGDAVTSADRFLDEITDSGPPWTAMTALLVLLVAVVAAATLAVNLKAFRAGNTQGTAVAAGSSPKPTSESTGQNVAGEPVDRHRP